MAEEKKPSKQHKIVNAKGEAVTKRASKPAPPPKGNAGALRFGAVILWLAAIACEVIGVCIFSGKIKIKVANMTVQLIVALVVDLICVIIASAMWKRSNRIDPASEKNKVKFWLWNNMGVIACVIAFVPFIILLLVNKDVDGKTKKIAAIVAVVALLIGGISSYDFNPTSKEQMNRVYWTEHGQVYHTYEDCSHLNQTETLFSGSVEEAIEAKRERLCKTCEKRTEQGVEDTDAGLETDPELDFDPDLEPVTE